MHHHNLQSNNSKPAAALRGCPWKRSGFWWRLGAPQAGFDDRSEAVRPCASQGRIVSAAQRGAQQADAKRRESPTKILRPIYLAICKLNLKQENTKNEYI
jgi:hypothetical protein